MTPLPQISYRILPNGSDWYWEIIDSENGVVARGIAEQRVRARADVFRAAYDHCQAIPQPYPKGRKCRYSSST